MEKLFSAILAQYLHILSYFVHILYVPGRRKEVGNRWVTFQRCAGKPQLQAASSNIRRIHQGGVKTHLSCTRARCHSHSDVCALVFELLLGWLVLSAVLISGQHWNCFVVLFAGWQSVDMFHFQCYRDTWAWRQLWTGWFIQSNSWSRETGLLHNKPLPQVSQRDILNSIDREMSGDLKAGFKCIGEYHRRHSWQPILAKGCIS